MCFFIEKAMSYAEFLIRNTDSNKVMNISFENTFVLLI